MHIQYTLYTVNNERTQYQITGIMNDSILYIYYGLNKNSCTYKAIMNVSQILSSIV